MTNTQLRIISAIVMMIMLIAFSMVGSSGIILMLFLVGFLLIDEVAFHILKVKRNQINYIVSQLSYGLGYYFFNYLEDIHGYREIFVNLGFLINLGLLGYLFFEKMEQKSLIGLFKRFSFISGVFVLIPMMSLCFVVKDNNWINYMVLLLAFNFSVDTGAWFFGKRYGNKKLWPSISPKKTINGAIGGSILSVIVASLFSYYALDKLSIAIILAFLVLSCFAQLGDLIESKFKRQAGIKDSSALIPGHGGVYDRVDSLLFVAPFYVFVLKLFY